jgi:hypothetical protein
MELAGSPRLCALPSNQDKPLGKGTGTQPEAPPSPTCLSLGLCPGHYCPSPSVCPVNSIPSGPEDGQVPGFRGPEGLGYAFQVARVPGGFVVALQQPTF